MNLEIMEFYPTERNDVKEILNGTMRIRLPNLGIQILGIFVTKKRAMYFFNMPSKFGFDEKQRKEVRYPIFVFDDREKQRQFMEAVKIKGRAFIEAWLLKSDSREKQPLNELKASDQVETKRVCKKRTESKETAYNSKPLPEVAIKEYRDPPQLKKSFKKSIVGAKAKR
jgi:hypothetical protein